MRSRSLCLRTDGIQMTDAPIEKIKINQVVYTKVEDLILRNGEWWVHFEGSRESMCFGKTKPWEKGAEIKITFEEMT